jgi:hypothetical protein
MLSFIKSTSIIVTLYLTLILQFQLVMGPEFAYYLSSQFFELTVILFNVKCVTSCIVTQVEVHGLVWFSYD